MGVIKTMKEVESALPQKKEINYVRALDKEGNPILISKDDLAQVVGELIPIANATQNGLLSKQTAPSTLYIRNKTYIELHHSLPADWNTFMFLLMISGTGIADGDAVLIIHGSNKSNSEGRCIAKSLYGNLPKSLQLKWEQKPDKSIYIYLVEAEGGKMGGYRLFKQHCCLENENTDIIALDTLDISALKDLVVS